MNLLIDQRIVGDTVVVALDGIADLATAPDLRSALARAIARASGRLVIVDLDGVRALDDVALGVLLGAAASARAHGGELAVVATATRLRERLAATRFDRAVAVRNSIA